MALINRSLVTFDDLSNGEIEGLFSLADEMSDSINEQFGVCQGRIMASLFFEPSTRTRLSFETAMHRLGGSVISAVDIKATSLAKGESIADMARVVGSYADIIVIRHPWEGAAKVVADYAGVPVINAGDGGHQHPTQTLCDLYTLKKERHTIKGLRIALCGDLKYGRTVHSLAYGLARFDAEDIIFIHGEGLEIPSHVLKKLTREYGGTLHKIPASNLSSLAQLLQGKSLDMFHRARTDGLDVIYMTPSKLPQQTLRPTFELRVDISEGALYISRLQKERVTSATEGTKLKKDYPVIDKKLLNGKDLKSTLIMHPLPRVDELAYEVDADPRSMYFKQAAWGVPVRMALIALLLGTKEISIPREDDSSVPKIDYPVYRRDFGVRCRNLSCVSFNEARYIKPEFKIVDDQPLTLRCVYCEHELQPQYIASSDWHEGRLANKTYHSADTYWVRKIKPENLIIFDSESEAQAWGLPSHYTRAHH